MALSTPESNLAKVAGALKQENNTGITNAEQKALAKKTAERVAKDNEKRFGIAGALDIMAESTPKDKITEAVEAKVKDPAKKTRATDLARAAKHLGEFHYDSVMVGGVADKEQGLDTAEQGHVRGEVDKVITRIPEIVTLLSMGGINKTAFIETIIKDPVYAKKVREQLKAQLGKDVPDFDLTNLKKLATQKKEDIEEKNEERNAVGGIDLNSSPGTKNVRLMATESEMAKYQASADPNKKNAASKIEMFGNYRGEKARLTAKRNRISLAHAAATDPTIKANLLAEMTAIDTQVGGIDTQMATVTPDLTKTDEANYLGWYDTVQKTRLTDAINQLNTEKTKADHDVIVAETKYKAAEDAYIAGLNGVVETATAEFLKDRMEAAEKGGEKTDDEKKTEEDAEAKKKKEEKDRVHRKAMTKIRTTLRNPKGQVNKVQAEVYFNKLLVGDPRSAMEPMVAGMTPAERDIILNDEAFCQNAAMMMLRAHLEKGKVTKDNINALADTDWGEKIIDGALDKEAKAAEQLGKLEGRLYRTAMERLKGWSGAHKKQIIIGLLAAIATGMLYPAVVGVLAAEGLSLASVGAMATTGVDKAIAFGASGAGTVAAVGAAGYAGYKSVDEG